MKIGVLTYDHPHRKTQDLLFRLKLYGYEDITLLILPWEDRKTRNPLYQHRLMKAVDISVSHLCSRLNIYLGYEYDMRDFDKVLIGGAGVIPVTREVINSHPGYLPNVRGLDALKWAILEGQPIGVTTHYICEQPDCGTIIRREIISLSHFETFHSVAQRVYEKEIEMLVDALTDEADGKKLDDSYPLHRRMSPMDEVRMMARLNEMVKRI